MSEFETKILALIVLFINIYNLYNAIVNKRTGIGWWEQYSREKSPVGFFIISGMSFIGVVICALLLLIPYDMFNSFVVDLVIFLFGN